MTAQKTVGRDPELALIRGAVEAARVGRGRALALIGHAGFGKTRLLHEAAAIAAGERMTVLSGSATESIKPPAYGTIAGALRSWTRAADLPFEELAPFAAGLRRILPEWPEPQAPIEEGSDLLRLLVLEGAVRLSIAASRPYGAAIVLDDLHDAGPETVEIVQHLAASIGDHAIVLVTAMRSDQAGPAEREARASARRGHTTIVDVGPLTAQGSADLARSILEARLPEGLVDELVRRGDGSPLLIEELIDAYVAAGELTIEDRELVWTGTRAIVPPTIIQSVRRRLAQLSPEARAVLGAGAVLGTFEQPLLEHVSEIDPRTALDGLDEGIAAGLLVAGDRIAFRHALVMDATTEALVPTRKAEFHRRAAEALETLYRDDPKRLEHRARHLEEIGRNQDAAEALQQAASHALDASAPATAEALLRHALSLEPGARLRAAILDGLARASAALGRWDEALSIDREAGTEEPDRLLRMARNALRSSRLDEADELIAASRARGGRPGPVGALAGLIALWRGEYDRALTLATEALTHGENHGDATVICDALDVCGRAKDGLGRREEAIDDFRRWEQEADRAGMTASRVQALMEIGNIEYMRDGSPETLRSVRREAHQVGTFTTLVLADLSLTWCLGSVGELDEALEAAREAVDFCRRFRLDLLPHALNALAWAMGRKNAGSGSDLAAEATTVAPRDADAAVCANEILADSLLRLGRYDESLEHYERGWELIRSGGAQLPAMTPFVRVCALAAAGRASEAATELATVRSHPSRDVVSVNGFWLDVAEALVAGDHEAMHRILSPERTRAAGERAVASLVAADALGGPHAAGWVRAALETFEHGGAEADAGRARALLRTLGAPVPRKRRVGTELPAHLQERGITRREAEVLDLIGKGMTNPEIAAALFLSVRTIESHVSSLLSKLGVEGRPALIALALAQRAR